MKRSWILLAAAATAFCANSFAVDVQVTAYSQVQNLPTMFSVENFALLRPWEIDTPPSFKISSAPTSGTLSVNPLNISPALELNGAASPNNGLSWFYYCNGLTFNYAKLNGATTVVFTGQINNQQPGTGVQCTCTGPACSTTETVPAIGKLVMG